MNSYIFNRREPIKSCLDCPLLGFDCGDREDYCGLNSELYMYDFDLGETIHPKCELIKVNFKNLGIDIV